MMVWGGGVSSTAFLELFKGIHCAPHTAIAIGGCVSTNLGLIHSNLTRLLNADSNYNWYFELYVGLKLPVFRGMCEFLFRRTLLV